MSFPYHRSRTPEPQDVTALRLNIPSDARPFDSEEIRTAFLTALSTSVTSATSPFPMLHDEDEVPLISLLADPAYRQHNGSGEPRGREIQRQITVSRKTVQLPRYQVMESTVHSPVDERDYLPLAKLTPTRSNTMPLRPSYHQPHHRALSARVRDRANAVESEDDEDDGEWEEGDSLMPLSDLKRTLMQASAALESPGLGRRTMSSYRPPRAKAFAFEDAAGVPGLLTPTNTGVDTSPVALVNDDCISGGGGNSSEDEADYVPLATYMPAYRSVTPSSVPVSIAASPDLDTECRLTQTALADISATWQPMHADEDEGFDEKHTLCNMAQYPTLSPAKPLILLPLVDATPVARTRTRTLSHDKPFNDVEDFDPGLGAQRISQMRDLERQLNLEAPLTGVPLLPPLRHATVKATRSAPFHVVRSSKSLSALSKAFHASAPATIPPPPTEPLPLLPACASVPVRPARNPNRSRLTILHRNEEL